MVPVIDLSRRHVGLARPFRDAIDRILASGTFLLGPETEAFERAWASFTTYAHTVAVSSGAAALQLSLQALGIGPGDEVVVPAFTAVPTAAAVCAAGAIPAPADVDHATGLLDPCATQSVLTERTRAVIPVHLYGRALDLEPFTGLGIDIVEDAAQAHGALEASQQAKFTCYSFYPTKNLGGVGDGGAIVTDDADAAAHLRHLRVHGMTDQYVHTDIAQNFRISEIEAAWLGLALDGLVAANVRRRAIAASYRAAAPDLRWAGGHERHVFHLCVVRVGDRDGFRDGLRTHGVASAVHYPLAITQQPAYKQFTRLPCPEAEAWAAECVSIPCFPELTDSEVDRVAAALGALSRQRAW